MNSVLFAIIILLPALAWADIVISRPEVTSHVTVRTSASSQSSKLGELRPGQSLPYAGSVSRWHKVELPGNQTGFVSKRWTTVKDATASFFSTEAFTVHFLDVGVGDAAIIDIGDREVIIDGGNYINDIYDYITETGIVDGPIELAIVTHGDQDHWKGLSRLLGHDRVVDNPYEVLEYWDPGYDRDCNLPARPTGRANYLAFVEKVKQSLAPQQFKRPLENFHPPMDQTGNLSVFSIPSIPEIRFTVLHSEASPAQTSCSYMINNASIVLMVEIDGIRMLFTGDANGKGRQELTDAGASHVEKQLLDAANLIGEGVLQANLLKVPHHGSETANTQDFIKAVNPDYVIISAATNHHLPKQTVIDRYISPQRVILRTDRNHARMRDHIICGKTEGVFDCQYASNIN
ncbi:MAG: SH3 domain-containing protein [Halopseudomonas sp.]